MRRSLLACLLGAALVFGTAGSCQSTEPTSVEYEDCDAEDYRNRERECGFTDADRKKLRTPAPKVTKKRM